MRSLLKTISIFLLFGGFYKAQISKTDALFLELKKQDSLFFERGFNQCDIQYLENATDDNLKFFHDTGGFQDKKEFIARTKKYICSKPNEKVIRKVQPESLEVFPLYNNGQLYGAIQSGEHDFFLRKENKSDSITGTAKFTSVWLKNKNTWKLSEVLSYNHQEKNQTQLDSTFIENLRLENKIPTLGFALIENGKISFSKVFGEISTGTKAPQNSIFNVASLAKPITAVTVLKLVELGLWNLDEPLSKYWIDPDIKNHPFLNKVTTRSVLSHQTGFPNWRWENDDKKLDFKFEPNTKYQYSGEGFEYLRKAIELKFNKSLEELAETYVFRNLKMNDTHFTFNKVKDKSLMLSGFSNSGEDYGIEKNNNINAADDLLTTIDDYSSFLTAILNQQILNASSFKQMTTEQVKTKGHKAFGLGFEIYKLKNNEIAISHGGSDIGAQTIFFLLPASKSGLLIFTNKDDGYKIYEPILKHFWKKTGEEIIDIELK
ncbi:class A beta-lactamase-related serine hydrolase [Soonwooa sp.]|uniref:class A beta-lactamase-related serine hydrolase n=1 Tax=Soonwooa sp. TaxID=1938592 RepID=UPI00263987B6|nr:class A beta-lactamase-related serine hydrolase [Soonwooa sp.]